MRREGPIAEILTKLRKIKPNLMRQNDLEASRLFAEVFRDKHRYCDTGEWFRYDGGIWKPDTGGLSASADLKILACSLGLYAAEVSNRFTAEGKDKAAEAVLNAAGKWKKAYYRQQILKDSRDQVAFSRNDLDKDPYMFCLENCVLRLHPDGLQVLQHNPDWLLSKKSPVAYDPKALCQRYDQFLQEIMQEDAAAIDFLERYHSSGLIGVPLADKLLVEFGQSSRNGKSTLEQAVAYVLGDYAASVQPDTLAARQSADGSRPTPDIARLAGVRFVTCPELPRRMPLNSSLVKSLTGGDLITARFLNQECFSFRPAFNIAIHTNALPSVSDLAVFRSGRMCVLPFTRHFTEEEQDPDLAEKLQEEAPGILNRMIAALYRYYADGLKIPEAVRTATKDFEIESDRVGTFVDEMLVPGPGCIEVSVIYPAYDKWCRDSGYQPMGKQSFIDTLKEKQLHRNSGTVKARQPDGSVKGVTRRNVIVGYSGFVRTTESFEDLTRTYQSAI